MLEKCWFSASIRLVKLPVRSILGTNLDYLNQLCDEWNSDFNGLAYDERQRLYHEMCITNADKIVDGFNIKRCNKPGGEWIVTSNRNPVSSTKKEMAQAYPKTTTDEESAAEGVRQAIF